MQKAIFFLWAILLPLALASQDIFLSTLDNRLFRLDLDDCSYVQVGTVPLGSTDISFHPNGKLYSINSTGRLFEVDPTLGLGTLVHVFEPNPTQLYTSLTVDANGVFYAAGLGGSLWIYDLAANTGSFLGNIGYGAEGDLTFRQGELYMAATNDRIVRIDLENPANSTVVIQGNVPGRIFGIVSYAADCEEVRTFALTNNAAQIYEIDFENAVLVPYCNIPLMVSGGASTYEYWASQPIEIEELSAAGFTCAEASGAIAVSASGGTGGLSYSLDGENYQADSVFTGLPLGAYIVYVQDEVGCTITREILAEAALPSIAGLEVQPASCGEANGRISVAAAGGTPPYALSINGAPPQPDLAVSGLAPGLYQLSLSDALGCMAGLHQAEIADAGNPQLAALEVQPTSCGEANGSIFLTVEGGAPPLQYAIEGGVPQASGSFSGLSAGEYDLVISDVNGCTLEAEAAIASSTAVELEWLDKRDARCGLPNGSFRLRASGGQAPFRYALDGLSFAGDSIFIGLPGGDYAPAVLDAAGCRAELALRLGDTAPPRFTDLHIQAADCNEPNGSIRLAAEGGTGPLALRLEGLRQPLGLPLSGLRAGSYPLELTDSLGCAATLEVRVPRRNCPVYLPNAFSPNRDGRNDWFYPQSLPGLEAHVSRFLIFDRWGGLAFAAYEVPFGHPALAWDGRRYGREAPAGLYVYLLVLEYPDGQADELAGELLLLR
jgi:gliding motility-associated-like protein